MPVRRSPNHIPAEGDPKQGIVTILAADNRSGSIRRTLSADMSSKKWLQHNGFFSPIKKIVSSHHIAHDHDRHHSHSSSSDDDESDEEFRCKSGNQDDVWRSIQLEKGGELDAARPEGVWGMILTQKSDTSLLQAPAPYVHPMVNRTRSGLSEKSLEVCTESLGSETGSDCFSCTSDEDDDDQDKKHNQNQSQSQSQRVEMEEVPKYKKSAAGKKPFPPPLPSIAGGDGDTALHMHSRREDGRLVVEAVSVAPRKYFHAARSDGRLLLTLNRSPPLEHEKKHNKTGSESESTPVVEGNPMQKNATRTRLGAKKLMAAGNINPKWANVPPRPPAPRAAATAFNAYEYFWRSNKPGLMMMSNKKSKMNEDLVMYMRGCKEARRSLIWEPYCIATS